MKNLIKSFTGQIDRLKARQNSIIFEGQGNQGRGFGEDKETELMKEAFEQNPIYGDQLELYEALKAIKVRM